MEAQLLENYLETVRGLVLKKQEDLQFDNLTILNVIQEHLNASAGNSSDEAFFNGELYFYQGHYEQSLKYYLEAKEVPGFQFFCYRASSLISEQRGQPEKALDYAQKALKLDALDPTLQRQLASLHHVEENNRSSALAETGEGVSQEQETVCVMSCSVESASTEYVNESRSSFGLHEPSGAQFQNYSDNDRSSGLYSSIFETKNESRSHSWNQLHKFVDGKEHAHAQSENTSFDPLEQRIQDFQRTQTERMHQYLLAAEKESEQGENTLHILNGWNLTRSATPLLFTEESRKSSGGHFLRWNGKGIAINPGRDFMENFHTQGLSIRDIDFVIVTRDSPDAFVDVRAISDLNHQLNKSSPDRQIIHYYLHQKVFQELSPFLKPTFKQARNTIHKLEMYLDSPDVEKIELADGIVLHYFLTTMPETLPSYRENPQSIDGSNLGIRLELSNEEKKIKLGYLSGLAWSPLLVHHLGHCDLILAAFGNTSANDYFRLGYNDDSLGYFGIATLLEELAPRLLLLTEFAGREGDIRIEVIKKMRAESGQTPRQPTAALLPADIGLVVNLNSLDVKCSISEAFAPANEIRVTSNDDTFGRLNYLSTHYCA